MTACLLIGGGGFIGHHLASALSLTGREITVVGRRPRPMNPLPNGVSYVSGDFGDLALIQRLLEDHQEVVDLAYASIPQTSFQHPLADISENLPPVVQLFSEAARLGIKRLVAVSSGGTVYGEPQCLPMTESHPTNPISPYGVTKLTLEKYAGLFHRVHGLPVVCVRPGNPYGEGQRPYVGQGFIATAMALVSTRKPVVIFGENGSIRDYLHVSDVVSGIVSALEQGVAGTTYNIGSGAGRTNVDLLAAIEPIARKEGFEILIERRPARPFDVTANVLDSSLLKAHTGWFPTVSLEEGLAKTWQWLRLNHA